MLHSFSPSVPFSEELQFILSFMSSKYFSIHLIQSIISSEFLLCTDHSPEVFQDDVCRLYIYHSQSAGGGGRGTSFMSL